MTRLRTFLRLDLMAVLFVGLLIVSAVEGLVLGHWAKGTFYLVLAIWLVDE